MLVSHKACILKFKGYWRPSVQKWSVTDMGIHRQLYFAALPHKVTACANTPKREKGGRSPWGHNHRNYGQKGGSIYINSGALGKSDSFTIMNLGIGGSEDIHRSFFQNLKSPRLTSPSHKYRDLTYQGPWRHWGKKGSVSYDGIHRRCCFAPLPHKVASCASTPRLAYE